jgi:alkaline phosphatase D
MNRSRRLRSWTGQAPFDRPLPRRDAAGTVEAVCTSLGRSIVLAHALLCAVACARLATPTASSVRSNPHLTHGVVVGSVRPDGAVLWARCSEPAVLELVVDRVGATTAASTRARWTAPVRAEEDFVGKREVGGLLPATDYVARARCLEADGDAAPRREGSAGDAEGATARFRTAPPANDPAPVRFVWSGDLGGQNVCRDREQGYPIFDRVREREPDFFVGLGDMIYADDACLAVGRYGNAQVHGPEPRGDLATYRAIWAYNRADPAFARLLATTPYEATWDDHEVVNDFGPRHDAAIKPPLPAGVHLMPLGRRAFLDWSPLLEQALDGRLYRSLRWGRHLELFFLDTRSHRDANASEDRRAAPKTILGRAQRAWLEGSVRASDATWKVFVTSVPLSIPTGRADARDSFASGDGRLGFERELAALLRALRRANVTTPVFITTDVHFQYVARHTPFPEHPAFQPIEIAVGPLTAGLIPPIAPDRTLHPWVLYTNGPQDPRKLDWAQAQRWFNFGVIDVDAGGTLRLAIVDGMGATRYELALDPG